jgi:hypothetical protein
LLGQALEPPRMERMHHDSRARHRLFRLVAAVGVLFTLWACGPVYIPVPPPSQIAFTAEDLTDASGATHRFWITAGGPDPSATAATFFVLDIDRNAGVIAGANPDGSFLAPPFEGTEGDHISIYYRDTQGRSSGTTCRLLGPDTPFAPLCP